MEGVLVNNLFGDNMKVKFHILGIWEVIVQLEIFYVSDKTFSCVSPEAWSVLDRIIAELVKVFGKFHVGNDTCLL